MGFFRTVLEYMYIAVSFVSHKSVFSGECLSSSIEEPYLEEKKKAVHLYPGILLFLHATAFLGNSHSL